MKFAELIEQLAPTQYGGALDLEITAVAPVTAALPGMLSYIESEKFASQIPKTQASVLILPQDETLQAQVSDRNIAWLATPHPRLMFAQAIALFYQPYKPAAQIHPSAVIDATAQVGENVAIGAHVVIGANAVIGNDVCVYPNVVIYPAVKVGDRTLLHANCTIHERTQIGSDCVIHSGAVVGAEGFGFVPTPQGWYKMQQGGFVVLEDRVEVGCNSAIDRPAVGETRIGRDTKLDNLVHVGHGCVIGQGCAMAAQVGLAGGVELGNGVILAGQVGLANNAKMGDGAIASSKSGVHGTVEPGQVVSGYPAIDHRLYLKASAIYNRLPEMYQMIKRLKKSLQDQ